MYIGDNVLWVIAQERQQEFLKQAEARRIMQQLKQGNKSKQLKLWQRLSWRLGGLMITWGHRLQLRQEHRWV